MRKFISEKAEKLKPSGIRKFFGIVEARKDVISLGVGEPDFLTPWNVREAGVQAIRKGYTQYTSNAGLPALRKEVAAYLDERFNVKAEPDDVIITLGASEAIDLTLRAVTDPGDEILIPEPSYVSYAPCVELAGGKPVSVKCTAESGFKLMPEMLERAVTPRTKALIFPFPNNPTGAVMEREYIEKLIPVILKRDLLVISDEIYAELTYGTNHCSIASFERLKDRVVLIGGFSKSFAMTGWRIGFTVCGTVLRKAMLKIHQYVAICAPIMGQYAALEALSSGKKDNYASISEMRNEYDRRRKYVYGTFLKLGLDCFEPRGAFYIFPCVRSLGMSGDEFAERLLGEQNVAVVPGSAFGESGADFIRCSYAYSMKSLSEAMTAIEKFIKSASNR